MGPGRRFKGEQRSVGCVDGQQGSSVRQFGPGCNPGHQRAMDGCGWLEMEIGIKQVRRASRGEVGGVMMTSRE